MMGGKPSKPHQSTAETNQDAIAKYIRDVEAYACGLTQAVREAWDVNADEDHTVTVMLRLDRTKWSANTRVRGNDAINFTACHVPPDAIPVTLTCACDMDAERVTEWRLEINGQQRIERGDNFLIAFPVFDTRVGRFPMYALTFCDGSVRWKDAPRISADFSMNPT